MVKRSLSAHPPFPLAADQLFGPIAQQPVEDTYTVSAFNEAVKDVLKERFSENVWLSGEVQDFDRNRHRENIYFNLVEHEAGSDRIKAKVSVVIWGNTKEGLLRNFRRMSHDFELKDGLQVRFLCQASFFVRSGSFILYVRDVDPTFTLGKLMQAREETLRELSEQGLLEKNKGCVLSQVPLRIGLITAKESAAYHDFLNELKLSGLSFVVQIFPSFVQGEQVAPTVTRALRYFAEGEEAVDVVVLIRGGGSRSDLIWFDNKEIALAIAHHPKPVLTGIGHEIDRSVADFVSYANFKTPTAVAGFLIDRVVGVESRLDELLHQLVQGARDGLQQKRQRLGSFQSEFLTHVHYLLRERQQYLQEVPYRLQAEGMARVRDAGRAMQTVIQALGMQSDFLLKERRQVLMQLLPHVSREVQVLLRQRHETIADLAKQKVLLDPANVLGRGYSITRSRSGRAVTDANKLSPGDVLTTTFAKGTVESTVR